MWKCMECNSMVNHKGLCRSCTKYDSEGNILEPMPRVRVNRNGDEIVKNNNIEKNYVFRDGSEGKKGFRAPKKLTKKQLKLKEEEEKAMVEALKEVMSKQKEDADGILEFGEVVGEEE